MRSLLRFLHVEGEIGRDLAGAVPRVGSWRLASLLKALDAGEVARLLESCDQSSAVGSRDFALDGRVGSYWFAVLPYNDVALAIKCGLR